MKISTIVIFAVCLMICLAGCNSMNQRQDTPEGYGFTYNGISIALNTEAAPVIDALGEPKNYTEETSCAFDGLDKTYYYGAFYLSTFPMDGKDYVYSLWFADDSVSTEEGIRIGNTRAEVEAIYGAEQFNGSGAYVMIKHNTKLTIILDAGVVTSIQYEVIIQS